VAASAPRLATPARPAYERWMLATLFAATEAELDALFPEWMVPRAVPETRTGTNPFDGEPMTWVSWLPDGEPQGMSGLDPASRPGARELPPVLVDELPAEAMDVDEVALPLRTVPHVALRDVSGVHLDAVAAALGLTPTGRPARVAPDGTQLDALDPAAGAALLQLDDRGARALAGALAGSEAFGGDDLLARRLVASLRALGRAAPGTRICIHCTP
jgi:hypothetical protein